jgi:hypothetical protein
MKIKCHTSVSRGLRAVQLHRWAPSQCVAHEVRTKNWQIVWACAIVFVVARAGFWLGYRLNPLYRAPGMSATAYMNLGLIAYVLFRSFVV